MIGMSWKTKKTKFVNDMLKHMEIEEDVIVRDVIRFGKNDEENKKASAINRGKLLRTGGLQFLRLRSLFILTYIRKKEQKRSR